MTAEIARPENRLGTQAWLLLLAVLFLAASLHLLFPDRRENWKPARLTSFLVYYYNADSSEYAFLTATFPNGFARHNTRIDRPLYSTLGFFIYEPLRLMKPLVPEAVRRAPPH